LIENQLLAEVALKFFVQTFGRKPVAALPSPPIYKPGVVRDGDGAHFKKLVMSKLHFTTKHANAATVQREWFVVDGTNQTVGRMCSRIAAILRGKHKANYTPHVDTGDYVIVINCDKVVFTGNKFEDKKYQNFSGYPGGLKEEAAQDLIKRRPEAIIERAVKGMLPKNRLGRKMYKKLFVYAGAQHPHTAQQPKELKF
jgi:large subunit ribosomal protein L13